MSASERIEENLRIMRSFYAELLAGNFEGLQQLVDPEMEVHEPDQLPFGGVYKGLEEVNQLFAKAASYFAVSDIKVESITAGEDRAVGLLQIKLPTRDEPIAVAEEAVIQDGRIVRVRVFHFDPSLVQS